MEQDQRVVEIRDPEIDVAEIMDRVRERIRQRRAQAKAQGLEYDRLVDARPPVVAADHSETDFQYDLRELQISADGILVTVAMRDRQLPLLNSLFYRAEMLLHRLALKYVNQLAGRQVVFNTATANVLAVLARRVEQSQARAQQLDREVNVLRERIAELERTRDTA